MTADPRARWAEELAVPLNATADATVATFLRALPGTDFVPRSVQVAALNALGGTGLPTGPDPTAEMLLRDEVEAFAKAYWTLEPAERLVAWAELSRRGAPAGRLRELEPALDIAVAPLSAPFVEELAALMRELFVLQPRERAIRRNTWLAARVEDEAKWLEAFAAVQRESPWLADLDSQLAAALSQSLAALGAAASAATASTTASRPPLSREEAIAAFGDRMREYERDPESEYERADSARAKKILKGSMLGFAMLVASCCLYGGYNSKNHTSSVSPPAARDPKYTSPAYTPPPSYDASRFSRPPSFTVEEVDQFKQYERDLALGRSAQVPAGYPSWVSANRPSAFGAKPNASVALVMPFSREQIQEFQTYESTRRGVKPIYYDYWVKAGKPTAPGNYPIFDTEP